MSKYKIDDVYVFYCNSGYVNANRTEEYTLGEVTGCDTQEELDQYDEEYINDALQMTYDTFLSNMDTGWYKKDE